MAETISLLYNDDNKAGVSVQLFRVLPVDSLADIFSFLTLRELAALDTSNTSSVHREDLFAAYRVFVFSQVVLNFNEQKMKWFEKRFIRLSHISAKQNLRQEEVSAIVDCVAQHFSQLRTLNFSCNNFLTSAHVEKISHCCQKLSLVDLSSCPLMCNDAVISLTRRCGSYLSTLRIGNCKAISSDVLDCVTNTPNLKVHTPRLSFLCSTA